MADATEQEKAAEAARLKAEAEAKEKAQSKTYSEEHVKELIAERDKAKEKLRKIEDAEKKAAEEKAIQEGKLKEVLASKEKELSDVQLKLKEYEAKETKQREALLSKLPEDKRAMYATVSTEVLEDLVQTLSKTTKETIPGRKQGDGSGEKKWEDLNADERMVLKKDNPTLYFQMLNEYSMRKNGTPLSRMMMQ